MVRLASDGPAPATPGLYGFMVLAALGAIVWLLYRIDTKLQGIGDMLNNADKPKQLTE